MTRVHVFATEQDAIDQADAVDALLGLPREPHHRGRNCPPAPFGRVLTWSRVFDLGGEFATSESPAGVRGREASVGQNRVVTASAIANRDLSGGTDVDRGARGVARASSARD